MTKQGNLFERYFTLASVPVDRPMIRKYGWDRTTLGDLWDGRTERGLRVSVLVSEAVFTTALPSGQNSP